VHCRGKIIDGVTLIGQQTKPSLQQTCGTKFLRAGSKNFRAAFRANSGDSRYNIESGRRGLNKIKQEVLAQLTLAKQ
jgi:hypothetical protein